MNEPVDAKTRDHRGNDSKLDRYKQVAVQPVVVLDAIDHVGTGTSVSTWGCARLKLVAPSTLVAWLENGAPDHPALVVPNRISLSYRRLRELAEEAAGALASHGIGRGERVAMVFPNGPEAILVFLAASMVGTACPLNAAYKEDEFRFYLADVGA